MGNQMNDLRVPAFCPLCQKIMKGRSTFSFYSHGVCVNCSIYFVEGREKRWESGWRPSTEEMKIYESSLVET